MAASCGVILLSGHRSRGRPLMTFGAADPARRRQLRAGRPARPRSWRHRRRSRSGARPSPAAPRSPVPFSSCTCSSASGSSAAASSSTRMADGLALPRDASRSGRLANISGSVTGRPRWSVPNGTGLNRSARPALASGYTGCRALVSGSSPTHSTSRPACSSAAGSGHTQPSGRRSPEASFSRRSMTSATVTP